MGKVDYGQRRLKRALIDSEKQTIHRWSEILLKHQPGSLIYKKAEQIIRISKLKLESLQAP